LNCDELFRVPPTTANDDAFGHDLAVAYQVLADDVNVVELGMPLPDVVAASTVNAAMALPGPNSGSLKPGSSETATLISIKDGQFRLR